MVSKQTELDSELQNLLDQKIKQKGQFKQRLLIQNLRDQVTQTESEIDQPIQKIVDEEKKDGEAPEQLDKETMMMMKQIEDSNLQLASFDDNTKALQEEMRASAKLREKLALEAMDEFF